MYSEHTGKYCAVRAGTSVDDTDHLLQCDVNPQTDDVLDEESILQFFQILPAEVDTYNLSSIGILWITGK